MRQIPFRVDWALDSDCRERFEPLFNRVVPLVPSWVDALYIGLDTETTGGVLAISFSHMYRAGRIFVTPKWFASSTKDQQQTLVHEMIHTSLSGLDRTFERLLEAILEEDTALFKWATSSWEEAQEQAISDLSFVFDNLMGES